MEHPTGDGAVVSPSRSLPPCLFRRDVSQWDYVGKLMEKDDPKLAAENAKAAREGEAT